MSKPTFVDSLSVQPAGESLPGAGLSQKGSQPTDGDSTPEPGTSIPGEVKPSYSEVSKRVHAGSESMLEDWDLASAAGIALEVLRRGNSVDSNEFTFPAALESTRLGLYFKAAADAVDAKITFTATPLLLSDYARQFFSSTTFTVPDDRLRKCYDIVERFCSALVCGVNKETLLVSSGLEGASYAAFLMISLYQERKGVNFATTAKIVKGGRVYRPLVEAAFENTFAGLGRSILGMVESLLKRRMRLWLGNHAESQGIAKLAKTVIASSGALLQNYANTEVVLTKDKRGNVIGKKVETRPPAFNTKGALVQGERTVLVKLNQELSRVNRVLDKPEFKELTSCSNYAVTDSVMRSFVSDLYLFTGAINTELASRKRAVRQIIIQDIKAKNPNIKHIDIDQTMWAAGVRSAESMFKPISEIFQTLGFNPEDGIETYMLGKLPTYQKKREALLTSNEFPKLPQADA